MCEVKVLRPACYMLTCFGKDRRNLTLLDIHRWKMIFHTRRQWRAQEFFRGVGGGVQQIQLTEGRENGDLGAVAR
jgi:hypothetical protein